VDEEMIVLKKLKVLNFILLICISTSLFNFAIIKASETKPTLWIKIHKIHLIDPIEDPYLLEGDADWHYYLSIYNGKEWLYYDASFNEENNIIIDYLYNCDVESRYVSIYIYLIEEDFWSDPDLADISSYQGGGYDNFKGFTRGTEYRGSYDLKTNTLTGDDVHTEFEYYLTSGEYDGSEGVDENDAALWFDVWDNYDPPMAEAGSDRLCYTGEKINFNGLISFASSGSSIVKYEWDFDGDRIIDAEGGKTSFTFTKKGQYAVTLTVTDSLGETDTDTCIVTVGNRPPSASFTYSPEEPTIQDAVHFYDTSSDPDGSIVSWHWDFGDGQTSTIKNPSHNYADKGTYWVALIVEDNDGDQNTARTTMSILNLPPIAGFAFSPMNPKMGEEVQFIDESQDPEGKKLNYNWDFGDGYTSTQNNPIHKFTDGGEYTIKLTIRDDEGEIDTISEKINIIQTYDLTIEVKDILGLAVSNTKIELFTDGECCASGSTDENGKLVFTELPKGNYEIQTKTMGVTTSTTCSLTQSITEQMQVVLSISTISLIGGAVAFVALLMVYLIRRRKTLPTA